MLTVVTIKKHNCYDVHVEEEFLCVPLEVSVAVPQSLLSGSAPHLTNTRRFN